MEHGRLAAGHGRAEVQGALEEDRHRPGKGGLVQEYLAAGDLRKAAVALVEALAVDSSRAQLTPKLVELYAKIDPEGCAVSRENFTPSLNVDCPLVHGDICAASRNVALSYMRTGQHVESAAIRRTAIEDLGCAPELLN